MGTFSGVELGGLEPVRARAVVVASGARYRRLDVPGLTRFETANVYYEATVNERQACGVGPVAVIGGGDSAAQAPVFLADTPRFSRPDFDLQRGCRRTSARSRTSLSALSFTASETFSSVALVGNSRAIWSDASSRRLARFAFDG